MYVHELMWYTASRYVRSIRFHCVSLTSCAVGQHSTFVGSMERPCRSCSIFACKREQCAGTGQCGLTQCSVVWSNVVCWSLCPPCDSSSNPVKCKIWRSSVVQSVKFHICMYWCVCTNSVYVKVLNYSNEVWCTGYVLHHKHIEVVVRHMCVSVFRSVTDGSVADHVCSCVCVCCSPSGRLDCCSACCSLWPSEPSARAVWNLWGRLPAQEEGEGHADCKWQWMVEWIVHVPNHHVWLHSQDDCQPAIVHEVAVSASGNAVCVYRSDCCWIVWLSLSCFITTRLRTVL